MNYTEALKECEIKNRRLCTDLELKSDLCCGPCPGPDPTYPTLTWYNGKQNLLPILGPPYLKKKSGGYLEPDQN